MAFIADSLSRIKPSPTVALTGKDREGARGNFEVKRPMIAFRHIIEGLAMIRDQAGEDIQPPGGAFRIGASADAGG